MIGLFFFEHELPNDPILFVTQAIFDQVAQYFFMGPSV